LPLLCCRLYLLSVPSSLFLFLFLLLRPPPTSTLFPYTTLFRSRWSAASHAPWHKVFIDGGPATMASAASHDQAHGLKCGSSSMVEQKLPKLTTRVRFPSPAPAGR